MEEPRLKNWENVQETLQASMKQEILAMREMLSNMHQEELSILAKDRNAWKQVMLERVTILSRLGELRAVRLEATQQLESMTKQSSHSNEDNCEILSMRDQLTALVEKMNQQNIRNQTLEASDTSSYPMFPNPLVEIKKRKPRTALATYPRHP
ncbi:MAG: hypothetical protein KGZ39_06895 [Simkania sp.]|nr:hypothetical protein [Simkania sp.]